MEGREGTDAEGATGAFAEARLSPIYRTRRAWAGVGRGGGGDGGWRVRSECGRCKANVECGGRGEGERKGDIWRLDISVKGKRNRRREMRESSERRRLSQDRSSQEERKGSNGEGGKGSNDERISSRGGRGM